MSESLALANRVHNDRMCRDGYSVAPLLLFGKILGVLEAFVVGH